MKRISIEKNYNVLIDSLSSCKGQKKFERLTNKNSRIVSWARLRNKKYMLRAKIGCRKCKPLIDMTDLNQGKKVIIKWTKNLYCKERLQAPVKELEQRRSRITEEQLVDLFSLSKQEIIEQQEAANKVAKSHFTNSFNSKQASIVRNHGNREAHRRQRAQINASWKSELEGLQIKQSLNRQQEVASKANQQWKQEYFKQCNMLQKEWSLKL